MKYRNIALVYIVFTFHKYMIIIVKLGALKCEIMIIPPLYSQKRTSKTDVKK